MPTESVRFLVLAAGVALTARSAQAEGPPADEARGLEEKGGVEAVDAALLLPRVILGFPRIAFSVVTFPVVGAVKAEDEYHVMSWLEDLFYNDARTAAIMPVISFATFTGSSAGLVAFHNDLFGNGEHIRARTQWSGSDEHSHELSFGTNGATSIGAMVRFERAPDLRFNGIGADGPEARFQQDRFLAILRGGRRIGPAMMTATALYNHRTFGGGSIHDLYDTSEIEGYDGGIDTLELQAGLAYQTRWLRAEAFFGGVPAGASYLHWGAELEGTFELWAPSRRLILRGAVEGVDGGEVPFTDLPRLGGPNRLRGYPLDRFRGDTAVITTAEYRYPVHQFIDGALFVDAGRVTGNDWHAGGGMGIVVHSQGRVILSADLAVGDGVSVVVSTDPLRAFARKDTEL